MAAYDESKIHSLIAQWEMDQASGRRITPEELCKDTPELLEEFRKKLGQLHQFPASDETSPFDDKPTERDGIASTPVTLPTIPNYRIEGILGRGGMGVVYKAVQLPLNRTVALKMILSGEHASADERLRFLAEAEAIAKLQHPGIVQIYDFNTHGNHPFFAMEYLTGGSLDKKLNGTPLPSKEAAYLVQKLAEAVQAAHEHGIVHRDLKPANILITSNGQPKITDFGLAKTGGSNLTATGKVVGTPSYMSPEQAEGKKEVGPATDIYALGAILYECLSGRPPFKAATPIDTVLQVIKDEPVSIRQLQPNIPIDLETICHKCLQKDTGKRYGSAMMLGEDLARYFKGEAILARPTGKLERTWRWCRRNPLVAGLTSGIAATLVAATSISSGLSWWALNEKTRADDTSKAAQRLLTLQANREGFRSIHSGDHFTALLWFTQPLVLATGQTAIERITRERLWAYRHIGNHRITCSQVLSHNSAVWHAAFSPNGRRIITASLDQTARVWDALTGQPVTPPMKHSSEVRFASFSPDGNQIVTASGDKTAQAWNAHTGQANTPPMKHGDGVWHAAFSPNGRRIVTASLDQTARVWDALTGQPVTPPMKHSSKVLFASFSPDGNRVVTASEDKTAQVWDAHTGLADTPPMKHGSGVSHAAFSPNGRYVVTASGDKSARVWDASTGRPLTPPMEHNGYVSHASFSPDGRRVATASDDKTTRVWDAFTGQPITQPMRHDDRVMKATFSPDGRRVVSASLDKTAKVWDAVTGDSIITPIMHTSFVMSAAFSPDGRRVVTCSFDKTVKICDVATNDYVTATLDQAVGMENTLYSLDGRSVISFNYKTTRIQDALTGKTLTQPMEHKDKVNYAAFSTNGRRVVTASDDGTARVWDASTGQPLTPSLKHEFSVQHASFSPDSRRVVTASTDKTARVWDTSNGQPVTPQIKHESSVRYAAFSPDGNCVVTAADDKTVRVWDASTGQPITPPIKHENPIWRAEFSKDGRQIVTSSSQTSQRWFLNQDTRPTSDLLKLAQVYACQKIDDTGSFQSLDVEKELLPWYNELKSKYPEEFIVNFETTCRWRLNQIKECCKESNLPAALFHQNWLLAEAVLESAKKKAPSK